MSNNHLQLGFELFDNSDFIKFTQTPYFGLYLYLWRHIIRGEMYSIEKQYVHTNFYCKKNLLATTVGYRSLSKTFDKDIKAIKKQAKVLEDMGLIRIEKVPADYSIGRNEQTIFVLGKRYLERNLNGEEKAFEFFFLKDVFKPDNTSPLLVSNG